MEASMNFWYDLTRFGGFFVEIVKTLAQLVKT